jgi:hypothetical protein
LTEKGKRVAFEEAMLESDFCYSPMGGHGGDTGESERELQDGMTLCIQAASIPLGLSLPHSVPHATIRAPFFLGLVQIGMLLA